MSSASQQPTRLCAGCLVPSSGGKCPVCGWDDADNPEVQFFLPRHHLLMNRYYIGRVLGQGGFGVTYLARDLKLNRSVAIKEYLPTEQCTRLVDRVTLRSYGGEKQEQFTFGLQRFLEEAQSLARFSEHPNIVAITDFAEANGTAYLVMAYLEGITLKEHLANKGGQLPYTLTLQILMPIMDALREVHKHGLLHRDVSPDNIFLTRTGQVKLLDFGAARFAIGEHSQSLSLILKPGFSPEEQYRSKGKQGTWTDVYAVSATIYRCITGQLPPSAPDRLADDELMRPSAYCRDIPKDAENALLTGMAVRAQDRYQTIEQLQQALSIRQQPVNGAGPLPVNPPPVNPPPETRPAYKLYSNGAIVLATFFGTPLAGSILMATNFRRLQFPSKATRYLLIGFLLTALSIGLAYLIPTGASSGVALGMLFAMRAIAKQAQGKELDQHVQAGGKLASNWAAFGIAIACLAVLILGIGVIAELPSLTQPSVTIGTSDKVHYSGSATKSEAQALGNDLKTMGFFLDKGFDVHLKKSDSGTTLAFQLKDGSWDEPDTMANFEEITRSVASDIGGYPVTLDLTNLSGDLKKELTVGKYMVNTDEIYYMGTATKSDAEAFASALQANGWLSGKGYSVSISRNNDTEVGIVLRDGAWNESDTAGILETLMRRVAPSIGGLPIHLRMVNTHFEPQKEMTIN